jgi:hypothetical protein
MNLASERSAAYLASMSTLSLSVDSIVTVGSPLLQKFLQSTGLKCLHLLWECFHFPFRISTLVGPIEPARLSKLVQDADACFATCNRIRRRELGPLIPTAEQHTMLHCCWRLPSQRPAPVAPGAARSWRRITPDRCCVSTPTKSVAQWHCTQSLEH